jgi:Na+/H+-dicarboxylate symporter
VANVVGQSGATVLLALGVYTLTVMLGLATHALMVYTSVVRFFGKIRTIDFWRAMRPAQLLGFSTSSSSATLPVTMECVEKNLGVSNQVSSFVLPLGATVNMDGTALYQGVAAVFIAQVFDIQLGIGAQLQIVLTATLASIGTAGVPGVGMITLALVLTSIGVPTMGVALILGVDRILDMFRSATNLTGDASAAVMVASTEGETLSYREGLH